MLTPTLRPTTASKNVDDDGYSTVLSYTVDMNVKIVSSADDLDTININEYDILALSVQRVLALHDFDVWNTAVIRSIDDPSNEHKRLPRININIGSSTSDNKRHHKIHTKISGRATASTSMIFYAKCTILVELLTLMASKTKSESDFVLQYSLSGSDLLQDTIDNILPLLQTTKDITTIQGISVNEIVASNEYNVTSRSIDSRPPQVIYDILWNSEKSTVSTDQNVLNFTILGLVIIVLLSIIFYLLYQRNAGKSLSSEGDIEMNSTKTAVENPIFKGKKLTATRRSNSNTKYSLISSNSPIDNPSDESTDKDMTVQL